jgi:hypothetical protein
MIPLPVLETDPNSIRKRVPIYMNADQQRVVMYANVDLHTTIRTPLRPVRMAACIVLIAFK